MIRIGIIGDIGSGKTYVANNFGYPVFNADNEVSTVYKKNKKIFKKLNKKIPEHILTFPIDKNEITGAILSNKSNLKKIIAIVHEEIRKRMKIFLNKNKKKQIVILDIPLLLENKINRKRISWFMLNQKKRYTKKIKKRVNFNPELYKKFQQSQLSTSYKKRKSNFIIKNNFTKKSVRIGIKNILSKIK